jgi:hypothetical protein
MMAPTIPITFEVLALVSEVGDLRRAAWCVLRLGVGLLGKELMVISALSINPVSHK